MNIIQTNSYRSLLDNPLDADLIHLIDYQNYLHLHHYLATHEYFDFE
jgi:hypothetical protein